MKKNLNNKKKGFTLINLIVVGAIIMIIAIIAMPRIDKQINRGKEAKRNTDFATMYNVTTTALGNWYSEGNKFESNEKGNYYNVEFDNDNSTYNTLDIKMKSICPEKYTVTHKDAIVVEKGNKVRLLNDKEYNTWSVKIAYDNEGNLLAVIISNDGYVSVDGGEPQLYEK